MNIYKVKGTRFKSTIFCEFDFINFFRNTQKRRLFHKGIMGVKLSKLLHQSTKKYFCPIVIVIQLHMKGKCHLNAHLCQVDKNIGNKTKKYPQSERKNLTFFSVGAPTHLKGPFQLHIKQIKSSTLAKETLAKICLKHSLTQQ